MIHLEKNYLIERDFFKNSCSFDNFIKMELVIKILNLKIQSFKIINYKNKLRIKKIHKIIVN